MFDSSSVLYVMIEEDQDSFSLFDCLEALKLKHFLVYFHPNEIIIISLTSMVNLSDKLVRYSTEKIKEINIKKGWFKSKLHLVINNIFFTILNCFLLVKWQNQNLKNILNTYRFFERDKNNFSPLI